MIQKYPTFNSTKFQPDYDCNDLKDNGFQLKTRCNKNNPDCQKFIKDKKEEGLTIKIVDLDSSLNQDHKNMIDIWVKK
jgi:hypothetical protein